MSGRGLKAVAEAVLARLGDKPRKRTKYNAQRTTVHGITFDSKKEARRYLELKLLHNAGKIHSLILQPVFVLEVNGVLIAKYRADFQYFDVERGHEIVEDVKGMRTLVYRMKKLLMRACHGIEILET